MSGRRFGLNCSLPLEASSTAPSLVVSSEYDPLGDGTGATLLMMTPEDIVLPIEYTLSTGNTELLSVFSARRTHYTSHFRLALSALLPGRAYSFQVKVPAPAGSAYGDFESVYSVTVPTGPFGGACSLSPAGATITVLQDEVTVACSNWATDASATPLTYQVVLTAPNATASTSTDSPVVAELTVPSFLPTATVVLSQTGSFSVYVIIRDRTGGLLVSHAGDVVAVSPADMGGVLDSYAESVHEQWIESRDVRQCMEGMINFAQTASNNPGVATNTSIALIADLLLNVVEGSELDHSVFGPSAASCMQLLASLLESMGDAPGDSRRRDVGGDAISRIVLASDLVCSLSHLVQQMSASASTSGDCFDESVFATAVDAMGMFVHHIGAANVTEEALADAGVTAAGLFSCYTAMTHASCACYSRLLVADEPAVQAESAHMQAACAVGAASSAMSFCGSLTDSVTFSADFATRRSPA